MRLGGSMRRRRGGRKTSTSSAGGSAPGGSAGKGSARGRKKGGGGGGSRTFLLALVVLLLGSGTGYVYATQVVFPSQRQDMGSLVTVPDLRGMPLSEARFLLENRGLEAGRVDSIRHPAVTEGEIVGQSPLAGQAALPGAAVELTVSLGAERRPVPDVTRLRADRALTVLRTSGFEVAVDSVEADAPQGQVVATSPEAGTRVTLPASIRMTVSLGPPLVELPQLVGLQEEEARAILAEAGLEVGEVENRARFGFSQGDVLETFPVAGEMVPRGSAVRLVIRRRSLLPGGDRQEPDASMQGAEGAAEASEASQEGARGAEPSALRASVRDAAGGAAAPGGAP
jgi:beta-lactam-binding protein with PASTA domain